MAAYHDHRVTWVYNRVRLIDEDNKDIGNLEDSVPEYYGRRTITQAAWGSCILGCATSYRAASLMNTLPIGRHARAHDSWIQVMLHSKGYFFLDCPLQLYRLHGSNNAGWNKDTTSEQDRNMRDGYIELLRELALNRKVKATRRIFFYLLYLKKLGKRMVSQDL